MARKQHVDIEIDKLTNSIENVITGEIFETEFSKVTSKEIKKKDWLFDWHKELKSKQNEVYKMTTVENKHIIQGLISLSVDEGFVFVNLVENAKFNRGKEKVYVGVGGNLFAFACLKSKVLGLGGCISFVSKTSLFEYYNKSLGAIKTIGQRMAILETDAEILIKQYFKNK
ncbi:MAG: hypothetical protein WBM13_04955 [Bacteroidia bacterium]